MLNTICQTIDHLKCNQHPICIAIDGKCGSGKTTLASYLQAQYDCNVFHMDDFFLPPALRTPERYNQAGGNVDYLRFKQEVIAGIQSDQTFQFSQFNCKTMTMGDIVNVTPKQINIIEGSYSMHPTLQASYHLKIFLTLSPKEQCRRIRLRNGEEGLQAFVERWIPLENAYFNTLNIEAQSDMVFDTGHEPVLVLTK
jgi:uridine kinase